MEAFRRDVELQPTPANLNEVSWEMALDKLDLDQARKYSASSIEAVESQLNDVSLEYLSEHDIQLQGSLPYYWDTLGWIAFEQAKYSEAEQYLRAAWQISGHGEIGDHLGQLYEKLGRKQEAIEAYAGSLGSAEPMDGTKERLGALVGGAAGSDRDAKMARETKAASEIWQRSRMVRVQNAHGAAGAAEYWILLEPGAPGIVPVSVAPVGAGAGSVGASATGVSSVGTTSAAAGWEIASQAREVKFISGEDALKDAGSEIQKAKFEDEFVDGVGKHILRRGRLNCAQGAAECTLELETTDSVRQVK